MKPTRGLIPKKNAPEPPGRGHVGESVAGERLTAHDREDTNHRRSYGGHCANHQRHVDGAAGEEAGFKEDMHGVQLTVRVGC